jgi:hypothetical protein
LRWGWAIEIGALLVPVFVLTTVIYSVYKMCMELGAAMIYAYYPPF